jgi:type II secretory pathway component GspD/PulD (secretin)
MKLLNGFLGMLLAVALIGASASAQTAAATEVQKAPDVARSNPEFVQKTFYLTNVSQQNEGNEIVNAVRNLLDPHARVFFVPNQNALVVSTTPDQLAVAQKLISDLDRPKKTYRLTYTITETDGGKRVGTQHFTMVVVTGQRTVLKQGDKVPIVTGSVAEGTSTKSQVTYLDIGMNFDATLDEFVNGVRLRTKVEQLNVAEEKSGVGAQDPIIRQTALEGTSFLTLGKPLMLGSLDIPGTTRHLDLGVVMEQVVQ